ncbi:hypothetical protein CYLTODRAFT_337003, partial [Cylindrobasidium torrendii FP15055 ss-10]
LRCSNLKGYNIPGQVERLIATLFADDTTVFLSAEDSFDDLKAILDRWCIASGARFNIEKTQVIPIGSKAFINEFRQNRRADETHNPIPLSISIAEEGEAIRILGAWIGENLDENTAWPGVVQKIEDALERWQRAHSSIDGRRIIAQCIPGGMSQYLATVQGMPDKVEKKLAKIIRDFVWDKKTLGRVSEAHLLASLETGGRKILDIKSRNKAIQVMWLKSYLNLSSTRPRWAF